MPIGNAAFNLDSQVGLYVRIVSTQSVRLANNKHFIITEYGQTKRLSATHSRTESGKPTEQWPPTSVNY